MIGYYCAKCDKLNQGRQCDLCGKPLSAATYRQMWAILRVPASDTLTWKVVMAYLCITVLLILVLTLLFCLIGAATEQFVGILPYVLGILPVGALLVLVDLLLQGRESVWYTLESTGVSIRHWHKPSRIRSWSRLQAYDEKEICPQPDGSLLVVSKEVTVSWKDICRVKFNPKAGRIELFHTPHIAPVVLCIPAGDYEYAENLVKKACKGKF